MCYDVLQANLNSRKYLSFSFLSIAANWSEQLTLPSFGIISFPVSRANLRFS